MSRTGFRISKPASVVYHACLPTFEQTLAKLSIFIIVVIFFCPLLAYAVFPVGPVVFFMNREVVAPYRSLYFGNGAYRGGKVGFFLGGYHAALLPYACGFKYDSVASAHHSEDCGSGR